MTPRLLILISLFDGIGVARLALQELDWTPTREFGSEVLVEALEVTRRRSPRMTHLGDIAKVLIVAGTPCQDNSRLKGSSREGLAGKASGLFWELVRAVDLVREALKP